MNSLFLTILKFPQVSFSILQSKRSVSNNSKLFKEIKSSNPKLILSKSLSVNNFLIFDIVFLSSELNFIPVSTFLGFTATFSLTTELNGLKSCSLKAVAFKNMVRDFLIFGFNFQLLISWLNEEAS